MTPQFVVNSGDVGKALELVRNLGGARPLALPARLLGLGADEERAGIPTWAWALVAFGAGAVLSAAYWPKLRDRFR